MRSMKVLVAMAALATAAALGVAAARADSGPPWGPETPHFNLQVVLRPADGGSDDGFGLVRFRQPNDAAKIVYLDTWVRGLAPNHGYLLQRATDTSVDGACVGTNWLSLGSITTDETGTGRAALSRDLAAIPLGMQFDIHFRIVDAGSSSTALASGCYQFTVSQ